jgi:hypothetical protein
VEDGPDEAPGAITEPEEEPKHVEAEPVDEPAATPQVDPIQAAIDECWDWIKRNCTAKKCLVLDRQIKGEPRLADPKSRLEFLQAIITKEEEAYAGPRK